MDATQRKTAAQMVAEAKQRVHNVTPVEVAQELHDGRVVLVDLREPEERVIHGTIPGSVHIPRGMLEFYADPASPIHRPPFDPVRRVILYCAAGSRSALAADTLMALGYANVAHLDGGVAAWKNSGFAVDTTAML